MNLWKPTSQTSVDISSTLTPHSFIKTSIPRVAGLVGSTADDSPLWRSILDTYGKEILECASREFLDLATALRLETINTGDLNSLLAKAGRQGDKGINIVEGNDVDGQTYDGDQCTQSTLDIHSTSKVPDTGKHTGGDSTALDPSPAEASRGPKRYKKSREVSRSFKVLRRTIGPLTRPGSTALDKRNGDNVIQGRGCMRIQDQAHGSDVASGKFDPLSARSVGTVPRAKDPRPRFLAAMKRPGFEDCAQSVVEQSSRTVAQRIDFVVISDTERESGEEDE